MPGLKLDIACICLWLGLGCGLVSLNAYVRVLHGALVLISEEYLIR